MPLLRDQTATIAESLQINYAIEDAAAANDLERLRQRFEAWMDKFCFPVKMAAQG
jgi:hypothetical protein